MVPSEVFAQPSADHQGIVLVVDLTLALLIPILRRDHLDLHPHRFHPARRLIPKAARLLADHHPLGSTPLLFQPAIKCLRSKSLRRLRLTRLDLADHPVIPQVHGDRNLDQADFL